MSRKKKGNAVHGWVIVDKPEGVTSTQVVGKVRRIFDAQKAGHAGTLDPMATGVLAVALGEATKTVPYAMDSQKTYRFTARWGEGRDSDDAEGAVTETSDVRPSREAIEAAIPRFVGEIRQTPPAYSAIKVDGERAYDLARDGEAVELQPRTVLVHEARLLDIPDSDHAVFEMRCGKGTYVRAWVRDIARALGTCGHVSQLRRTSVGGFSEKDSVPLETLGGFMHSPAAFEHLRPISTALDGIPALAVTGPDAVRLRSGNP
ncbi:MAG TPA: tRNA pseudouridine(55) synthase TruB, partial [Rhizomicrobium sp.]|nr:tRNA pseudouridine(55) synthase TruB [Rhizomicrobium sp.]